MSFKVCYDEILGLGDDSWDSLVLRVILRSRVHVFHQQFTPNFLMRGKRQLFFFPEIDYYKRGPMTNPSLAFLISLSRLFNYRSVSNRFFICFYCISKWLGHFPLLFVYGSGEKEGTSKSQEQGPRVVFS